MAKRDNESKEQKKQNADAQSDQTRVTISKNDEPSVSNNDAEGSSLSEKKGGLLKRRRNRKKSKFTVSVEKNEAMVEAPLSLADEVDAPVDEQKNHDDPFAVSDEMESPLDDFEIDLSGDLPELEDEILSKENISLKKESKTSDQMVDDEVSFEESLVEENNEDIFEMSSTNSDDFDASFENPSFDEPERVIQETQEIVDAPVTEEIDDPFADDLDFDDISSEPDLEAAKPDEYDGEDMLESEFAEPDLLETSAPDESDEIASEELQEGADSSDEGSMMFFLVEPTEDELTDDDLDDIPTLGLAADGSAMFFKSDGEEDSDEVENDPDAHLETTKGTVTGPTASNVVDFYQGVLEILESAEDLGIDATAKARLSEVLKSKDLPQVVARDLVIQKIVSKTQLARAVARAQKRKEITTFLDLPAEAMGLRTELDSRVVNILRNFRVIPLWRKKIDGAENEEIKYELHLAHQSGMRDMSLETEINSLMPGHRFVWHFAMRDVCGAYWLAGENDDIDTSMEAEALLDRIVGTAIDARSSDIHIDPSVKGDPKAIVKYRIDGFVQSKEVITMEQLDRLRVRIENVARMPKVDLSHPNKGAFSRAGFDWRVQIQPHSSRQGPVPRIVIRRLQPDVMPMETLGYPEYFINQIKAAAGAPNGVIFWTGPTGSGKTESIHSAVVSVNPMGRGLSVHTIEDPPEKRVPGYAVQMEVSEGDPARSGLELLKSSLRADPDVVIFGEVRDEGMAKLVFDAANTGHLVFTTLHTNTSLDAVVRLDEIGIYGFMLSYVRGIAAQRLVRRVCTHCRTQMVEPDEYTQYVFDKYGVDLDGAKLFKHNPDGCASCNYTGYHGRIAIAEWLKPNKELVEASMRREYENLEDIARRAGWQPMGYMGVLHVKNGITDTHELSQKVLELSGDRLE